MQVTLDYEPHLDSVVELPTGFAIGSASWGYVGICCMQVTVSPTWVLLWTWVGDLP